MLFFVEAATSGSGLRLLRQLTDRGEPTVFVTSNRAKYSGAEDAQVLDRLDGEGRLFEVDSTEDYRTPGALVSMPGPHGVIASGDRYLAFAAHLAEDLGAPFPSRRAIDVFRTNDARGSSTTHSGSAASDGHPRTPRSGSAPSHRTWRRSG